MAEGSVALRTDGVGRAAHPLADGDGAAIVLHDRRRSQPQGDGSEGQSDSQDPHPVPPSA